MLWVQQKNWRKFTSTLQSNLTSCVLLAASFVRWFIRKFFNESICQDTLNKVADFEQHSEPIQLRNNPQKRLFCRVQIQRPCYFVLWFLKETCILIKWSWGKKLHEAVGAQLFWIPVYICRSVTEKYPLAPNIPHKFL